MMELETYSMRRGKMVLQQALWEGGCTGHWHSCWKEYLARRSVIRRKEEEKGKVLGN